MPGQGLAAFFAPESVAVVGASRDPSKVGGSVLANLRAAGFPGRIVPINPHATSVQGLPAVGSLLEADEPVDLAIIAVPAPAVLPALKECVAKGVGGAVVISAGFREGAEEGRAREDALRAWLAGQPIRILGPNCLGWIRPSRRLNATFAPGMPLSGTIGFVSHSGALATAILDWSRDRRLGFSLFASLGNQVDLDESALLEATAEDPETRVVVLYLEGVADGGHFRRALAETAARKPVVLLKTGRTVEGARAVSSHTGALAGSDRVFDAVVREAGAVRVGSIEALFDLARGLASQSLPRGRRLVIVTNGGGLGIVATDAARAAGLDVGPLTSETRARLQAVLPATASLTNPIDLVGDADALRYASAIQALGPASETDLLLVLLTAQAATDAVGIARAILGATRDWSLPVVTAFVGGARVAAGRHALEEREVPCYGFPEPAVAVLAGLAAIADGRRRARPAAGIQAPPPAGAAALVHGLSVPGRRSLGLDELTPLLSLYGVVVAPTLRAATPEEAARVAAALGGLVALKIVSPDVSHKTDVSGVRLRLPPGQVARAAAEMETAVRRARPDARLDGFAVQSMAPAGPELLVGVVRDAQFGPLVTVGFGGIYVEVLGDIAVRLAPIAPADADRMLDELRMAPVLRGVRGEPAVDCNAIVRVIVDLGRLAVDWPEISEIELNPLRVTATGTLALDARATVTGSSGPFHLADPDPGRRARTVGA